MLKPLWPTLILLTLVVGAQAEEPSDVVHSPPRADSPWRSSETDNFRLHAYSNEATRAEVLRTCEKLRRDLSLKWTGKQVATWKVPCHVVLHSTYASYERAVGRQLAGTNGATTIEFDRKQKTQVKLRRLDLMCDAAGGVPALAHELTHVMLVDWCAGRQTPRWFDEGLALLADSPQKQRLHLRDLRTSLANGTSYRVTELLSLEDYPTQRRVPAFYAQSLTLTRWLSERDQSTKILEFLARIDREGYDKPLREFYGIDGLAELEQLWSTHCEALASSY